MKTRLVFSVLGMLVLLSNAVAQEMRTEFHRITGSDKPVIDGNLDEEVWRMAPVISDFHQIRPDDHGVPSEKTEVQIARSDEFIYVAFKAYDSDIENLSAKGFIQGQNFFSDDRLAVYIDSFNDRRNCYFFQVNGNGIRRDALLGNDYFIEDWSTIWYANTQRYDWGWSAEMAIPVKSIAFDPNADSWGINFGRVHPRVGEEMAWSSRERNINPSVAGYIGGVKNFDQGLGLEFAPSVSLVYFDDEAGSTTDIEPSLTTFYNVTPFLTAGLTLNTDFSATDVDDRQLNLSRFSLFFPEKREFFLRDASIFEFGNIDDNGRPFFSRRIGLSSEGEPLNIDAGVKLSGRAGAWNVGALAIRQDAELDGADNGLFVGRVSRNVFDESEVGLITTSGDPTSSKGNSLVGGDYTYRTSRLLGDQRLRATAWYQETETDGFDDNQRAYGVGINLPNYKYSGYLDYRRIEENFNPALGFVNRSGVEQVDGQARYRHRLQGRYWQWLRTRVQYSRSERINGGLQSQRVFWNFFEGFSEKNDFFTFFIGQTKEGVITPFELRSGVDIPVGEFTSDRYGVFFKTGPQNPVSFELEVADGDFFGGSRLQVTPEVQWRPSKHIFASFSANENRIKLPQGNFTSRLYSARFNYAFDRRWAWLNVVQADNFSDTISINSRIRFQPRANREFFLVLNQTRDRVTEKIIDSAIVFKAAFNFRI
ncbi:MAG: hypothetical protein ACJARN_002081 [Arenicella sp.]|jgi:hypothetical protein